MTNGDTKFDVAKQNGAAPEVQLINGAFQITSLVEAHTFGKYVIDAGFYPAFKRASQVVVAMQIAHDNGVPFSLIASNIAFINGRACMYGDALIGIAHASHSMEDFEETMEGEGDTLTAVCRVQRRGIKTPIIRRFGVKDAKAANLLGKDTYKHYLSRMLQMRARSWALRDAGLVQGVIAREEAEDIRVLPGSTHPEERPAEATPDSDWAKIIEGETVDAEPTEPVKEPAAEEAEPGTDVMTMPCAECGKSMRIDAEACPKCGNKIPF